MNITVPKKLFLLGGHDLEMLTIKQLLERGDDCVVLDRHLRWDTAHLSAYQDCLSQYSDYNIFGIELQEDIPTPKNYHRIDHHNDYATKPSALEQVAAAVGVPLNREQMLIAANDKGYIPAMIAAGATKEEIASIRRRDREAQGVSEADEKLAEESIAKQLRRFGSLTVVKSMTSRFSPICDSLFPYRSLLIYTDAEWMFYGAGKAGLTQRYADEIHAGRMFHGGGDKGYIGAVQYIYSQEQIEQFVKHIIGQYEHI